MNASSGLDRTIKFRIGDEFVSVIETENQIAGSLFKDVYLKAFAAIDDFLGGCKKGNTYSSEKEVNNIFAFVGERGSGKSSCMQSVAEMLQCGISGDTFGQIVREIPKARFATIDAIDPGMFEENNNILQLVVGKLFKAFKNETERRDSSKAQGDAYQDQKRRLVGCFEEIYGNIRVLFDHAKVGEESLDALLDLAASYDLNENFRKLVDLYMRWVGKEDGILILQIDDIDLQTRYAYDMVEQIRKYMMHPNVVILMAVRISQLEEVITRQYVEEFSSLLRTFPDTYMDKDAPVEMSERYLGKLIPHERRLFLPEMEDNFTTPLVIVGPEPGDEGDSYPSVREAVLKLIFKKTRFLFYDTKGFTSYIVPRNLRELRSIVRLLYKMPDFRTTGEDGITAQEHPYNKVLFQKYFFETWLQNNLDRQSIELIQNVWNAELIVKNKLIVDYFKSNFGSEDAYPAITQIISFSNKAYDISVGDVLGLLDTMEMHMVAPKEQKLIFAIRSIYSMLLYQYYDKYTEDKKDNQESEILKKGMLEEVPDYLRFVGGAFINSNLYDLLPSERSNQSRMRKSINVQPLFLAVREILRNSPEPEQLSDPDSIAVLNLLEFTILNIVARDESRAKKAGVRSIGNPSYRFDVTPGTQYFQFDILGFTYNLPKIEIVYSLFTNGLGGRASEDGKKWLTFVGENNNSLFSRIINKAEQDDRHYKSTVCFRNSEVINSFVLHILQHRLEGAKDNLSLYAYFYKQLEQFEILTYDDFKVQFSFIGQFGDVLSSIRKDTTPKAYALFHSTFFPQHTLNINIKLNAGSKNSYDTLLKKIKAKNSGIYIDALFEQVFPERRSYASPEAGRLLREMKERYENELADDNG